MQSQAEGQNPEQTKKGASAVLSLLHSRPPQPLSGLEAIPLQPICRSHSTVLPKRGGQARPISIAFLATVDRAAWGDRRGGEGRARLGWTGLSRLAAQVAWRPLPFQALRRAGSGTVIGVCVCVACGQGKLLRGSCSLISSSVLALSFFGLQMY